VNPVTGAGRNRIGRKLSSAAVDSSFRYSARPPARLEGWPIEWALSRRAFGLAIHSGAEQKRVPLLAVWFTPHEWKATMFLDTTGEHTRLATSDDKVETG